jgi:hypothetical protein
MNRVGAFLALAILASALSGCTGSDEPIEVTAPDTPGGAYTFEANVEADNYTWDLGDHLTVAHGRSVTHAYDFQDGRVVVSLRARGGSGSGDYSTEVVLGSGQNGKPTFLMEAERNWTVPDEQVRFSARLSTDPDGDPLRYSWSCIRVQDAKRVPVHEHPGSGGVRFDTAPAGSVTSGLATGPLPEATMQVPGDLCDALGTGTRPSKQAQTIQGAFARTGVYDIYLLASDPVHPTVSGQFRIWVTNVAERPDGTFRQHYEGEFKGGTGGLQPTCDTLNATLPVGTCDLSVQTFRLPLAGVGGTMNVSFDPGSAAGTEAANRIGVELKRGSKLVASNNGLPGSFPLDRNLLSDDGYTVTIKLERGVNLPWSVDLWIPLDTNPGKYY